MDDLDPAIENCLFGSATIWPTELLENTTDLTLLFLSLSTHLCLNQWTEVLDFEYIAPVVPAWWINGIFFTVVLSTNTVFSCLSIHVFRDSSMRSPTNLLLAAITVLDLLTCLAKAPLNVYVYLMEGYKELPSYTWCIIYFYVDTLFPVTFHSAAFLLNVYLSVQRLVGVKDLRCCGAVRTYKGVIAAIVSSLALSCVIHSIYIIVFKLETVTAVGKQAVHLWDLYLVESCRIVSRSTHQQHSFLPIYAWLRLIVLQIVPALILSVCNIALIRASYRTHIYRKRLVGTVGTISETPDSSTIPVVIGLASLINKNTILDCVNDCSRQATVTRADCVCEEDPIVDGRRSTKQSVMCSMSPPLRTDNRSTMITCKVRATMERLPSIDFIENSFILVPSTPGQIAADLSRDALKSMARAQPKTGHLCGYRKCDNNNGNSNDVIHGEELRVRGLYPELWDVPVNKNNVPIIRDSSCGSQRLSSESILTGQGNHAQIVDVSMFDVVSGQKAMPHRNNTYLHLEVSRKLSVVSQESNSRKLSVGNQDANSRKLSVGNQDANSRKLSVGNQDANSRKLSVGNQDANSRKLSVGNQDANSRKLSVGNQDANSRKLSVGNQDANSRKLSVGNQDANSRKLSVVSQESNSTKLSVGNQDANSMRSLPDTSVTINEDSNAVSTDTRKPGTRFQHSHKGKKPSRSAEMRSTVLLILLTSSTLTFEAFAIVLLIVNFINDTLILSHQFVTYSDMALLNMISNMMYLATFPLSFLFLCGLSHAFREALKVRIKSVCSKVKFTFY